MVAACDVLPEREPLISGPRLAAEIERALALEVTEVPPVQNTSAVANVDQTYSAASKGERVLAIVFDSKAATSQISGRRPVPGMEGAAVLRRLNGVILYYVDPGIPSRLGPLREALARASGP